MNKLLVYILFFTCLATNKYTYSQQNALLYSVKHPKSKKTSYLLGTMHVMSQEKFFFPSKIEEVISNCKVLCLEVENISNQAIDPASLFDSNKSLKDFCSVAQWDSILVWAEKDLMMTNENFESNFKYAKPFVLVQLMIQNTLPVIQMSHEKELEKLADKTNMKKIGLETIDEQLNIFNNIEYPLQIEMIMSQLRDLSQSETDFKTMEDIYNSQNLDSLCAFSEKDITPIIREELLVKRNLKWISNMQDFMKKQSVFFAVGAAHLCGPDGLIELLSKEGYVIEGINL